MLQLPPLAHRRDFHDTPCHVHAHRATDITSDVLSDDAEVAPPEESLDGQHVALANVEGALLVHDVRAPNDLDPRTVTRDATDIATVAPTTTTLTDAGATPDTTHLYYVTAVDGSGNVATSGPVSASTPPAPPPDPNDDVWAAYDFATVDSTVVDTSGNGNDGTLVGEAVVVPNGRFGQAVELTGGVGRVDLGTMNIQGDQVTIDFDAIPDLQKNGMVDRIRPIGEDRRGDIVYTLVIDPMEHDERLLWNLTAVVTIDPA